jgi:cobalamin biosynthesis Co2+ chelatase CbiK
MKSNMKIKLLKERDTTKLEFNKQSPEPLPEPHFTMCIIGPTMSGKGVTYLNTFYRSDMLGDMFDMIIIVSPTLSNDRSAYIVKESDNTILYDNPNDLDNIIEEIMEIQQVQEGEILNDKPKMLLLLDDMLGHLDSRFNKLTKFCSKNRHYSCSLCCVIQSFRFLNNTIRANSSYFIIKRLNNSQEENKIFDEIGTTFMSNKEFKKYYDYATKDSRFDFLYVDMRKRRLYKNYDELLFDNDKSFLN